MRRFKTGLWLAVILALAMSLGLGCAVSQKTAIPQKSAEKPKWWFHDVVGVEFVQNYAKYPIPSGVLIADSRPTRAKFDKGFMPTAVNIPFKKMDKMLGKLPQDKSTLIIFYCQGPT